MTLKKTNTALPLPAIKGGAKAIAFFMANSKVKRNIRQLNTDIIDEIAQVKLPFTPKDYYDFADKYLNGSADEDLYLDEKTTYYREIITNDDELKCLQYLRQFFY